MFKPQRVAGAVGQMNLPARLDTSRPKAKASFLHVLSPWLPSKVPPTFRVGLPPSNILMKFPPADSYFSWLQIQSGGQPSLSITSSWPCRQTEDTLILCSLGWAASICSCDHSEESVEKNSKGVMKELRNRCHEKGEGTFISLSEYPGRFWKVSSMLHSQGPQVRKTRST